MSVTVQEIQRIFAKCEAGAETILSPKMAVEMRDLALSADAMRQERDAYWTVLELLCERFPDHPIGDFPGCVDAMREAIKRAVGVLLIVQAMPEHTNRLGTVRADLENAIKEKP